jgi:hypothetical protein
MKRLLIPSRRDNDEENRHILVIAAGYGFLRTSQNGTIKHQNRLGLSGTGHFTPGRGPMQGGASFNLDAVKAQRP